MRIAIIILLSLPVSSIFGQQKNLTLSRSSAMWLERELSFPGSGVHTSFRPLVESQLPLDSLAGEEMKRKNPLKGKSWLARKLRSENLIVIDSGIFHATVDPFFDLKYFYSAQPGDSDFLYRNTRGFAAAGDIGRFVSFGTSFFESQAVFPAYIREFIDTNAVVPGQGRAKPFKANGADFAYSSAYVSIIPSSHIGVQFGHGRQFIGDGYRSLLLSDNAFNYPYLRCDIGFMQRKIQYTLLFAWLQSAERLPEHSTPEALFQRKSGSFHYLNMMPFRWLQVGLFESVIWQRWDSAGSKPANYLFANPLPGVNTALYGLDDVNNALLGVNVRINPLKKLVLYGQFAMDDVDKTALQAGLKLFDTPLRGVHLQLEYNNAGKGMYSHDIPLQSYSHMAQFMTHPYGGNFNEYISFIDINLRDFSLEYKLIYADYLLPDGHLFLQDVNLSFEVNRKTHLKMVAGMVNRIVKNDDPGINTSYNRYLYFGLKTDILNQYFDF